MYELYIQDKNNVWQLADLGTDIPAINIQRNDIGELKDRQTDYSQAIKLPKTPTNVKIFSFISEFSTVTDVGRKYLDCRLYVDGCTIVGVGGLVKIVQITDYIEIQIVGGIKGFFTALAENNSQGDQKTLNDLAFNDNGGNKISIIRGKDGFNNSSSPKDVDIFFGIADFAEETSSDTYSFNRTNGYIQQQSQYPFVKYSTIINKILSSQGSGYTLVSNISDNIKYTNACIPLNSINQHFDDTELFDKCLQQFPTLDRHIGTGWQYVGKFTAPETAVYTLNIRLIATLSSIISSTTVTTCGYTLNYYVDNLVIGDSSKKNNITTFTGQTIDSTFVLSGKSLSKGDVLSFYLSVVEVVSASLSFTLKTYGETMIDNPIPITGNLPEKTQYDFFKDFLQMYGLTVDIDNETKTMYAYTFDKIIENKKNAKDWSKKYNIGSGGKKNTLGSYVQTNYIKYSDQSNDLSTSALFTEISEDVARYYFEKGKKVWYATSDMSAPTPLLGSFIENQYVYYASSIVYLSSETPIIDKGALCIHNNTLSETPTDLITFASETTKNIKRIRSDGVGYNYAKIKRLSSGDFPNNPSMRLCMFYQNDDRAKETITLLSEDNNRDGNLPQIELSYTDSSGKTTSTTYYVLGNYPLYAIASEVLPSTLGGADGITLSAQSMVKEFYGAFQEHVLGDVRFIEDAEIYLTPKDIQDYDPFTPVYIDYFGAYFYVNKIKNFVSGKLTKVDLVKI